MIHATLPHKGKGNSRVERGVGMDGGGGLSGEIMQDYTNPYPLPLNHCSSQGRLLVLVYVALQLYPEKGEANKYSNIMRGVFRHKTLAVVDARVQRSHRVNCSCSALCRVKCDWSH